MTEDEARTLLREFMERPDKGKEWPKVWIGDVISADELGIPFRQLTICPVGNRRMAGNIVALTQRPGRMDLISCKISRQWAAFAYSESS